MASTGMDWEYLVWRLIYMAPQFVGWCIAIFFCVTRRRENPKGSVFLGLAVMISLISTTVTFGWPYLFQLTTSAGIVAPLQYLMVGFQALTTLAFWGFLIAAVFARPTHYDFRDDNAFREQTIRELSASNSAVFSERILAFTLKRPLVSRTYPLSLSRLDTSLSLKRGCCKVKNRQIRKILPNRLRFPSHNNR